MSLRRILLLTIACCASVSAMAQRPVVAFAGIVYLGDYNAIEQNYPYTLALNRTGDLDRELLKKINELGSKYVDIQAGLANVDSGQSLVLAVGIEREFLYAEKFRDSNGGISQKLIADLTVQLMLVDFKTMTLQAAIPVSLAYNDLLPGQQEVSQEKAVAVFDALYHEGPLGGGLGNIATRLMALDPHRAPRYRVGVSTVTSSAEAQQQIPASRTALQVENYVGQLFTAELAKSTQAEVVPYSRDYAIAGQMSARFANGRVYGLKLPERDYGFSIVLQKYKRVESGKYSIFGSLIHLQMREEFNKTLYIDDDFRFAVARLPVEAAEDWPAYEDALESLFADLAKQLQKPVSAWFKEHAATGQQTYRQFMVKKEVFEHGTH